MKVVLLYRDGGNYKTNVTVDVPEDLEDQIELNKEFEIEQFDLTEEWLHEQTGNGYDADLDHNLVDVIEIINEDFENLHPEFKYSPENGDYNINFGNLMELAKGNYKYAVSLMQRLEWQAPETLIQDDLNEGEIVEYNNQYIMTGGVDINIVEND